MRALLPLFLLASCGALRPPPTFSVAWPEHGDGFCVDASGSGRATAGPVSLPIQVSAEGRRRDADLEGLVASLIQLSVDEEGEPVERMVDGGLLDARGRLTLDLDLPEPPSNDGDDMLQLQLRVDAEDQAVVGGDLVLRVMRSDNVPWIGCQVWQDADGTPIPADAGLAVGAEVLLAFHVEGDPGDDAPDAEITFRERGGDFCGPDPFGTFTTPVFEGANAVPWTVSLVGMDACESEEGGSELTFSTPSHLGEDGSWLGSRESAVRDVLP